MEDQNTKDQYVQKTASLIVHEFADYASSAIRISELQKIESADLISDKLIAHRGIGDEVRRKVQERSVAVGKMISGLAYLLEQENIRSADEAFSRLKQSSPNAATTDRLERLESAEGKIRLSFSTLSTLIDIFSVAMKEMFEKEVQSAAEKPEDQSGRTMNSHLKRALVVRELASFMYNYLSSFSITGIEDLKAVHRDMMSQVQRLKDKLARQDVEYRVDGQHEYLQRNEATRGALQVVEQKWDQFLGRIKETEVSAENGKGLLRNLKYIRDDAENQIEALEIIAASQIAYSHVQSISDLSEKLKKLAPPPIDAKLASQLLNFTPGFLA
jgi:hypothetical protein